MDAWIDTYHAVRGLTRNGTFVFLTDSAVGLKEEDNLRHLVTNLGTDVPAIARRAVPHVQAPSDYCLAYADRARQHGFESLVVLGGDKHVGPPRCVEHAWQLREIIREREAGAGARRLGQPARPCRDAGAASARRPRHRGVLPDADRVASQPRAVERFLAEAERRGLALPGMFGVFYYRSREPDDAADAAAVPACAGRGAQRGVRGRRDARCVCARSIRELTAAGVRHFYVSNLPGRPGRLDARPRVCASTGLKLEPIWVTFSTAFPSPASSASAT